MGRIRLLIVSLVLIVALLTPLFPTTPVLAQDQPIPLQEEPTPPPQPEPELPLEPEISEPLPVDPELPSLAPRLVVLPEDWVAVGEVVTATLTLINQAPHAAEDLTITLPLPAAATVVEAKGATHDNRSVRWTLGTLAGEATAEVTVLLRVTALPEGEALVLRAEITARGVPGFIGVTGGALITTEERVVAPTDDGQRTPAEGATATTDVAEPTATADVTTTPTTASETATPEASPATLDETATADVTATSEAPTITPEATAAPETTPAEPDATTTPDETLEPRAATAPTRAPDATVQAAPTARPPQTDRGQSRYTPGQAAVLRGRDNRVIVEVPANAFDAPLTLEYLSFDDVRPRLRARGQAEPPVIAGYRRGFGAFFLEATDDQGRDIHQFKAPLTVTIRVTPQQLEVLGIAPDDLTIFWFDETLVGTDAQGRERRGQWIPLRTVVDLAAGTATFQVDHFSGFQLSDGSSPSAAFLPSLQGWQVGHFTGAASFSYPIELPAGPNGIRPQLALTYSSAATDGVGGMRKTAQSSWVGKGWSLDTGFVALNKIEVSSGTTVPHYALSFNGRSYDLIRGAAKVGNPDANIAVHWNWHAVDESFIRVEVVQNGVSAPGSASAPGIGAIDYSTLRPRYKWVITDPSGMKYEFAEDLWWAWANCSGNGAFSYFENNRWLLSKVTDTNNNAVLYNYSRSKAFFSTCLGQAGTVDYDVWPTSITWANDRYKVEFVNTGRSNDLQFDWPAYVVGGPARETRQLQQIRVLSRQGASWDLVRAYVLTQDYSLYSDARRCSAGGCTMATGWEPETGYQKLTLKSIQRRDNTGTGALPALTFTYNTNGGGAFDAAGGWNRVTVMNNNQGGTLTMAYANIAAAVAGDDHFRNRHRVTTRTQTDGRGNSYVSSYAYGSPMVNTVGTVYGDDVAGSTYPTSAKLYYNVFLDGDSDDDQANWLVHRQWQEFQGHGTVVETHPTGAKTRYSFIQGSAGCTPAPTARGSHAAIVGDTCFQNMQRRELLMGRASLVEQLTSSDAKLSETAHTWLVGPVDYTWAPLSGLWRAFRYEGATESRTYEGTGTATVKRVEYYYNTDCSWTATLNLYGNLGCVIEKDRGTVVRKTLHAYGANTSAYIVDRNIATSILDSAGRYLAHSQRFYDNSNQALGTIGVNGNLTREIQVANMPLSTSITNVQLNGRDHTYSYDTRGNPTQVRSYTGTGWVQFNGSAWTASTPGNGSTARVTTTAYETIFHTFPTQITNPLGHIERAAYDYRMGTLIEIDGPNGANGGDSSLSCASFWSANTTTVIADDVSCAYYDPFGRMTKLARPGDSAAHPTLLAVYSDTASPFRYTIHQRHTANNTDVRTTRMYYDGLGRQIATKVESKGTAPFQSIATFMRYDGLGQVTHQSQPMYVTESDQAAFDGYTNWSALSGVRWTTSAYDALGRVTSVTTPDSQVSRSFYGRDTVTGLLLHDTVDTNRHRVQRRFDTLGRMTNVLELTGNCATYWGYTCGGANTTTWAVGATTSYAYSPLDLLTTVTDAKANPTTMSYDSLGRKTAMTDRDMGSWSYAYDANGNLTRQTDAKGQRLCFYYDALDRLTGKHNRTDNNCPQPGTSLAASYLYDAGTNGKGQRTSMSTSDGTGTTWTYTVRGQIASAVHTVGGMAGSWTFGWQYDSADRLKQITYPTASSGTETVVYGYDAAWRQQSVCVSGSGGCYAQAGTFDALNQPTSLTLGNNLRHTFTYSNPMARLSRLQVGTSTALGSIFDRSYGYDNVANVISITDNQTGGIAAQTYGYDERDRLTRWTLGSTTQTYAYDTIGNLTSKAGVSMTYGAGTNGTGAGPHQARSIGGATQTYDANGNLTSGMARTIAWNNENLPSSVTSGGVSETYGYNADSLRVKKVRGTVTTIYLEGLWEQTSSGTTRRFYTLNGQVVAVRTNAGSTNTVSYLHGDHLGSISVTTTSTGTAEPRQEFDPWGKVRSGGITATTRNYTGQILDDTGLLFYNARYYDPAIGRFISGDTVVPGTPSGTMNGVAVTPLTVSFHEGGFRSKLNRESKAPFWFQMDSDAKQQHGSPMGPANPQALNRYSYVQNNPLKYTDPTGHTLYTVTPAQIDVWLTRLNHKKDDILFWIGLLGAGSSAAAAIICLPAGPLAALCGLGSAAAYAALAKTVTDGYNNIAFVLEMAKLEAGIDDEITVEVLENTVIVTVYDKNGNMRSRRIVSNVPGVLTDAMVDSAREIGIRPDRAAKSSIGGLSVGFSKAPSNWFAASNIFP